MKESATAERRRWQRSRVGLPAQIFFSDETRQATTLNIGAGGACLTIERPIVNLNKKTPVKVEFIVPSGVPPKVHAHMISLRESKLSLHFDFPQPWLLSTLISSNRKHSVGKSIFFE